MVYLVDSCNLFELAEIDVEMLCRGGAGILKWR